MRINIRDKEYRIKFMHEHKTASIGGTYIRGFTNCDIYRVYVRKMSSTPDLVLVGKGIALCSEGDNFNKAIGRKVALTRALTTTDFPKSDRAEVWKQYFNTVGF